MNECTSPGFIKHLARKLTLESKRRSHARKDEEKVKCLKELSTLMERKNPCRKDHDPATLLDMATSLGRGGRQKLHGCELFAVRDIPEDQAEGSEGSDDSEGRKKREGTPYKEKGVVEKIEAELAELMVKQKDPRGKKSSTLPLENLLNNSARLGEGFAQSGGTP